MAPITRSRALLNKSKKGKIANKENRGKGKKFRNWKLRKFWRFTKGMKSSSLSENAQSSHASISSSMESININNSSQENECILIEQSNEVIVIDDDDDCRKTVGDVEQKQNKSSNQSLEDGEIIDTDAEASPKKTANITTKKPSPMKISQSPSEKNNCVFYKDLTIGSRESNIPLYETIRSSDSFFSTLDSVSRDDVICLDSSLAPAKRNTKRGASLDDSVIFVSEQIDLDSPIYIPLSANNNSTALPKKRRKNDSVFDKVIQPFKKFKDHLGSLYSSTSTPKVRKADGLFTLSEQKKIQQYNTNTYNPNKEKDAKKTGKRMVIVDGSNVAFGHSLNKEFSVKGLEICLDYFDKMGHEVKAVVPQFRLQKSKSSDPERLERLHREGKIVFTPCKNLPGKSTTCYDDRFILQLATEFDAAVVSNDNYRDLIHENPAFKKIIENRVVGYTWCNDMFILPKDPYGRIGPSLSVILNRV